MTVPRAAVLLFISAIAASFANAQTLTTLHIFTGVGSTDGGEPQAGLVQGTDGNFYGTTWGTVFKITSAGTLTTLAYTGTRYGGLVQGSDGNFYGVGSTDGTVFKITSVGTLTTLYQFSGPDGADPTGSLVQGSDGNFYGTTSGGGSNRCECGTVFRISPSGTYTNLYSFAGYPTDGANPQAGLVQGSDGNFYGTTAFGGTNSDYGTVFKISSAGTLTTLHAFTGTDGTIPQANLIRGTDGYFYGTTQMGGDTNGAGTVFKITPTGRLTTLYNFTDGPDGGFPNGLVLGSDGNFYGTTQGGGTGTNSVCGPFGTIFQITPAGTLTTLYDFTDGADGATPEYAGVVQGIDSCFYGTTYQGGSIPCGGAGTVFKLCVPLSPPPNQITSAHLAATNIIFTVSSIAGETYQLQFSSSMNPTNWVNVSGVSVTNGIGAVLTLTNFGGAVEPQGFYRFMITP